MFSNTLRFLSSRGVYTSYYFVVLLVQRVVTVCSRFLQLLALMLVCEHEISLSVPDRFLWTKIAGGKAYEWLCGRVRRLYGHCKQLRDIGCRAARLGARGRW